MSTSKSNITPTIQRTVSEVVGPFPSPDLVSRSGLQGFAGFQRTAQEYCSTHPLPNSHEELWRYTRPELFSWKEISQATTQPLKLEVFGSPEKSIPSSVIRNQLPVLDALLSKKLYFQGNPAIDNLQIAYAQDVTTLTITQSISNDQPIQLSRLIKQSSASALFIEVQEGVSCTLIEDLESEDPRTSTPRFVIPQIQILQRAGSTVEFVSVQRLGDHDQYYGRFKFYLERDAQLRSVFLALGSQTSRVDLECVTGEPGARAEIGCLYLAGEKRHVDFHTEQQHVAPHCYSNLQCKGALRDSARGVYFGFIRVAEGAQKSDAYQKARTILLSKQARADNIPNLEIKANDVKCSHGASVAQVSGEELFYLRSRGISQQAAEVLLLQGFFEDTLQKISNKNIQEYCMTRVMERL